MLFEDEDEEKQLREILAALQREYTRAAKPYVDRLVHIYSLRPPSPVVVNAAYESLRGPERFECVMNERFERLIKERL